MGAVNLQWAVIRLSRLEPVQMASHDYSPVCCGWYPTAVLVETSAKFRAIADPKYYQHKFGFDYEVKPVIRESNEKNNELTISKSELKPCSLPFQRMEKPQAPQMQVIRPPR